MPPRKPKPSKTQNTKRRTKAAGEGIASVKVSETPGRGRPTLYTEAVAAEICQRISEGETLNQICRSEHMPARPTIISWVLEDRQGFSDRYARARLMLLEHWSDEIVDISDDGVNDWIERETEAGRNTVQYNGEHVARSRLRVDTRKWLLSKLKPERYGDRVDINHGAQDSLAQLLGILDGSAGRIPSTAGA